MLDSKKHTLILVFILVLSFLIRFVGLGYSNFYGDETKVFYLDKTIPAFEFFMDQRKGPIQFFVVWLVEKFSGVPDELYTRLPFAFAGFLSVVVFYLLSKKLFNDKVALLSTILFSFSGFNIAFSRTVQYQSFLILFGLSSIYLFLNKKYLLSSIALALAFLSHYDAVFFTAPLLYLAVSQKINFKKLLIKFILPFLVLVGLFYVPYIFHGYFSSNTLNYVSRRVIGSSEVGRNYSAFTFIFYNPCIFSFLFLLLPLFLLFKDSKDTKGYSQKIPTLKMLFLWFIIPFVSFQFLMTNPGTHIHKYLIPLYLLTGYAVVNIYEEIKGKKVRFGYMVLVTSVLFVTIARLFNVYVPRFNSGYPWNLSSYNNIHFKYQLFVYGFPYYRHWDEVRDYFNLLDTRVEGVYTNDNDTIAQYYLRGIPYTKPGTNFLPQYYIYIKNNQEFLDYKEVRDISKDQFYSNYQEVKRFSDDVVVYKRIDLSN